MALMQLKVLKGHFAIHRLSVGNSAPESVYGSEFFSITRTEDELSIVCDASILVSAEESELDWSVFKVIGPLDFSLTGILAGLADVLADAQVSIFAISTYDTDYVLVKSDQLEKASAALMTAGYTVL